MDRNKSSQYVLIKEADRSSKTSSGKVMVAVEPQDLKLCRSCGRLCCSPSRLLTHNSISKSNKSKAVSCDSQESVISNDSESTRNTVECRGIGRESPRNSVECRGNGRERPRNSVEGRGNGGESPRNTVECRSNGQESPRNTVECRSNGRGKPVEIQEKPVSGTLSPKRVNRKATARTTGDALSPMKAVTSPRSGMSSPRATRPSSKAASQSVDLERLCINQPKYGNAQESRPLEHSITTSRPASPKVRASQPMKPSGSVVKMKDEVNNRVECSICCRFFAPNRVEQHEEMCARIAEHAERQKKRRPPPVKEKPSPPPPTKNALKKLDWRRKHAEFINAIVAAREMQAHLAQGGKLCDLPPPPPLDTSDYVQCPHCQRKFNEAAAERHIPFCEEQHRGLGKSGSFNAKRNVKKRVTRPISAARRR